MVLLLGSKPSKRSPYIQVLTKAHETLQYQLCPFPILLTSLYYPLPRHTIYPCCDSHTEAGYVLTVVSAWKALPLDSCRAHALISFKSSLKSQLLRESLPPHPYLQRFPSPLPCLFFSLALFSSSIFFHIFLFSDSPILAITSIRLVSLWCIR